MPSGPVFPYYFTLWAAEFVRLHKKFGLGDTAKSVTMKIIYQSISLITRSLWSEHDEQGNISKIIREHSLRTKKFNNKIIL